LANSRLTLAMVCLSLASATLGLATLFALFAFVAPLAAVGTRFSSRSATRPLVAPRSGRGLGYVVGGLGG